MGHQHAVSGEARDLICVDVLVVWAVHHLVPVVLIQNLRVVADALNVQVLPLVVETIFLQTHRRSAR